MKIAVAASRIDQPQIARASICRSRGLDKGVRFITLNMRHGDSGEKSERSDKVKRGRVYLSLGRLQDDEMSRPELRDGISGVWDENQQSIIDNAVRECEACN